MTAPKASRHRTAVSSTSSSTRRVDARGVRAAGSWRGRRSPSGSLRRRAPDSFAQAPSAATSALKCAPRSS